MHTGFARLEAKFDAEFGTGFAGVDSKLAQLETRLPEIDRAGWFSLREAKKKILRGQVGFLEELVRRVAGR